MSEMTEVQDDLSQYRQRRERELSSLYATARSLTALGEVDEVLASIVRHAHELIGTDFTYLSVFDAEGNLSLKSSEGTISSDFKTARVPADTGIGARIVETGSAHWASNYLEDTELHHDEGFDLVVRTEGLKALLGVPLLVAGRVVGILYAADRTERPFEPDEVALLSAFADHAAVALENARLYDESRSAVQRLQEAYATIEHQVATMERSAAVHEALTSVVLTGGGPGDVAQLLVGHMGGNVTIVDRTDQIVVSRSASEQAGIFDLVFPPEVLADARRTGRCAGYVDDAGNHHSVAAMLAGDSYLGSLILSRTDEPHSVDVRTLERSAQIMGLLTLKRDAVLQAEERVSGELLTEILTSSVVLSDGQRSRAEARSIDVDRLDALVVVDAPAKPTTVVARKLQAMSGDWKGLAGEHHAQATMLIRADDVDLAAKAIHRRLRAELNSPVAVVAEHVVDGDWARGFALASRCCAILQMLGHGDRGATTEQYGMYALVFDPTRERDLERFLGDSLGPLIEYDRRRSTDLVTTVNAYFSNSGNLTQTSRAIHVHMNTLIKRLERVGALLGEDWKDPETALRLHLASRLNYLRKSLGSETSGVVGAGKHEQHRG